MNIGEIITADSANGTGIRVSIFVSGCTNHCEGCFQPQTWDFSYGRFYDRSVEDFIIAELQNDYYEGLTILGGEPFEIANQGTILNLIRRVRSECSGKNIWMYSGFTYESDLADKNGKRHTMYTDEILDSIDVLVDGKFEIEKKNITLNFRGSENQRIIDMKETRRVGRVVLSRLNNTGIARYIG